MRKMTPSHWRQDDSFQNYKTHEEVLCLSE
jgi:hypothetical protein